MDDMASHTAGSPKMVLVTSRATGMLATRLEEVDLALRKQVEGVARWSQGSP